MIYLKQVRSYKDFLPFRVIFALVVITDHLSQEMYNPGVIIAFSWYRNGGDKIITALLA